MFGLIGALTGVGALINSLLNTRINRQNSKAVTSLETGKLDLGVASLGLQAMQAALEELRLQIQECDEDRAALQMQIERRQHLSQTD